MPESVDQEAPPPDAPVELIARVVSDGGRFVATVDGMDLEGSGRTPNAAQNALVQSVRGWLERQDTAGRLPNVFGRDDLDETAEIVLRFVDGSDGNDDGAAS